MPSGEVGTSFGASNAYAQSFGALADKTVYSDPMGLKGFERDLRKDINDKFGIGLKAHSTESGGAGTAGYAMIPVYVDPRIIDTTRKYTPLVELIPRVTNMGMYADYNKITAKGGAFSAAEDGSLSETNTTYDRASTQIKFLYAVGRVTGPSVAAQPSYVLAGMMPGSGATGAFGDQSAPNAKQQEVLVKARELREYEENTIINGNATSTTTDYDGIVTLMGSTNTVDKNTSALSLDDVQTAIRYAFDDGGRPNLAVAASDVYTDLLKLLTAKIGYMSPVREVFWGFETIVLNTMVGQVPVIPSMFLSNTSGSKAIYFLDMSVVEMRVLQDMTYEELAKTNDSEKFMMKIYEALIIKNTSFCASITEIA
jgi:hypothetical protein